MTGSGPDAPPLAIYVHWPFCEAICPYCDFNVVRNRGVDQDVWTAAFRADILAWRDRVPNRRVSSIFFGGGTPSLMAPETAGSIIEAIEAAWGIAADAEITLEANPTSVEASRFRGFVGAGVNRLSIGLQSLRDDSLRRLGRRHDAEEGKRAMQVAQDVCPRVSFDLIYGRPGQGLDDWAAELREALQFGAGHCSLYQLTIEPGTPFAHQRARGRLDGLPDEDEAADFYDLCASTCSIHGLQRYEISSYASAGDESAHNKTYWDAGDWLGLGPGAHGRLTLDRRRIEFVAEPHPTAWLTTAGDIAGNRIARTEQSNEEAAEEVLFSGLRQVDGFSLPRLRQWGYRLDETEVDVLTADSLLATTGGRLHATARGLSVVDGIVARLVPLQPVR